jgi:hypothetical protein
MNKIVLSVSLALAQLLAVNAFAQSKGEADPAGAKAMPSAKATPQEKAAAKATRKEEGAKVSKAASPADAMPSSMGEAKKTTKAERKAAAAKRKAAAAAAVKKGETTSGEK